MPSIFTDKNIIGGYIIMIKCFDKEEIDKLIK